MKSWWSSQLRGLTRLWQMNHLFPKYKIFNNKFKSQNNQSCQFLTNNNSNYLASISTNKSSIWLPMVVNINSCHFRMKLEFFLTLNSGRGASNRTIITYHPKFLLNMHMVFRIWAYKISDIITIL